MQWKAHWNVITQFLADDEEKTKSTKTQMATFTAFDLADKP